MPDQALTIPAAHISRDGAAALIAATLEAAAAIGSELAVAVVDGTGTLRAFQRTDGAPLVTAEIAIDKAWSAAASGRPTALWNRLLRDPDNAPLAKVSRLLAASGGYPLTKGGLLLGGIGVSGGSADQDEQVTRGAIQAVGFDLPVRGRPGRISPAALPDSRSASRRHAS